jgi:hypothetical protein
MDKPVQRRMCARFLKTSLIPALAMFDRTLLDEEATVAFQKVLDAVQPSEFTACGDEPVTDDLSWMERMLGHVKRSFNGTVDFIGDSLKAVVDKIFEFFSMLFGSMMPALGSVLEKVKFLMLSVLQRIFKPVETLKNLAAGYFDKALKVVVIIAILIMATLGLVSFTAGYLFAVSLAGLSTRTSSTAFGSNISY